MHNWAMIFKYQLHFHRLNGSSCVFSEHIDRYRTIGITFVLLRSNFITLKNTLDCPPPPSSRAVAEGVEVWPWLELYGTLTVASVNHKTLVLKIISVFSFGLSHDLLSEEYSYYFCLLRSSYIWR